MCAHVCACLQWTVSGLKSNPACHLLQMRWWHQAHFPLWGRHDLLDRSHAFYWELLENATSLAKQQGFRGARWQKMLALANRLNRTSAISVPWLGEGSGWTPPSPASDDQGLLLLWESANGINPVLTWNQGPVIWLADAIRRSINATQGAVAALAAVERLSPLVFATADTCADMPFFNETSGYFELGAPTLGAEEFGTCCPGAVMRLSLCGTSRERLQRPLRIPVSIAR